MAITVRYLTILGLILTALLLQGCPMSMAITVHNNTKSEILVELKDGQMKWPPGASLRFDANMDRLQWVHEDNLYIPLLTLSRGGKVANYRLISARRPMPSEYIAHSPGKGFTSGTEEYRFQLEANGNLYVVRPGSPLPATALEPQPPGFPIKPDD